MKDTLSKLDFAESMQLANGESLVSIRVTFISTMTLDTVASGSI